MAQEKAVQKQSVQAEHETQKLGPFLCWAVVFADIGTSIYYVPGILYGTVGKLAGFFVFLTMTIFILLTFKYVEVTYRFPQGGGVVTVAARALNHWFGALGGMFILVDYFLTAAISCLSGMLYLSVVLPILGPRRRFSD
jgi:amino acid transporter